MKSLLKAFGICIFFVLVCFSVASSILMVSVSGSSSQGEAESSISGAEQSVALAYAGVLDAERTGANVSSLGARLNDAAELLSEAHMAFEAGNFTEAVRCAELSTQAGSGILEDSYQLRVETEDANGNRAILFLVVSVLAVAVVVVVSLFGYRHFERWYYRRLLKMKPRVGNV